jgi:hypothetical protein
MGFRVGDAVCERLDETHEDFSGFGAGIGLRAEADFASNDSGPQFALGAVVVGGNLALLDPMIKSRGIVSEPILDAADAQMLSGLGHDGLDLLLELLSLGVIVGVGDRLRAQVHGGGPQWDQRRSEGSDFGVVGKLFDQVLDFAQQMSLAVLQVAGDPVIAVVAVDDQDRPAADPPAPVGARGRARVAEQKQTQGGSGKQPGLAGPAIVAPAGLVGMADGAEAIVLDQVRHPGLEQAGQPMQHLDQGAEGHAELFRDGAQRDPVAIVQPQDPSDQLIAQQMCGQHGGGLGLQAAAAAGAILFLQLIDDLLGLQGRTVEDGTQSYSFVLQWAATVWTDRGSREGFEVVGLGGSQTLAAVAGMSSLGAAGMRAVFLSGRGLEGDFR